MNDLNKAAAPLSSPPPRQITSLDEAISTLLLFSPDNGWVFRGQSQAEWPLLPAVGRAPYSYILANDIAWFEEWRRSSAPFCDLPSDDYEALAYAQHYGLPTRLLDWTRSALVALFFACEKDYETEGAVFAYVPLSFRPSSETRIKGTDKKIYRVDVRPFDTRISAQQATFVFFPQPLQPLEAEPLPSVLRRGDLIGDLNLVKFLISPKDKLLIANSLRLLGFTRSFLFPDVEGLSASFRHEIEILRAADDHGFPRAIYPLRSSLERNWQERRKIIAERQQRNEPDLEV
ncbi:MAG TPA: FRG domain-containing protein [Methylomirabilota bacterium]|nr:FRG domain-containing protein [Methylomirabilota bacterium]